MIDFKERGISKHQCLEVECNENMLDQDIIMAFHAFVGSNNELDCVMEVLADMSAEELNRISCKPESLFLPRKLLYANVEEIKRCAEILKRGEMKS